MVLAYHLWRESQDGAKQTKQTIAPWWNVLAVLERHSVLPMRRMLPIAAFLSLFYIGADYFWYAALTNVSVAAGTAIFNCSPLFVYCFSICFLHESVTLKKIGGVVVSFVGVMLVVAFQDGNALDMSSLSHLESSSFIAGLLVLLCAALYGGYEVAFRVLVGEEITDTATLITLTGFAGLFTVPVWIVGSLLLNWCSIASLHEPLGWPTSGDGLLLLMSSGVLAVIFNVFLPLSICWTSPLETSVGCMLTIPLSAMVDTVLHHTHFSVKCLLGSFLVMAGFGILEYQTSPAPSSKDDGAEVSSEDHKVVPV